MGNWTIERGIIGDVKPCELVLEEDDEKQIVPYEIVDINQIARIVMPFQTELKIGDDAAIAYVKKKPFSPPDVLSYREVFAKLSNMDFDYIEANLSELEKEYEEKIRFYPHYHGDYPGFKYSKGIGVAYEIVPHRSPPLSRI